MKKIYALIALSFLIMSADFAQHSSAGSDSIAAPVTDTLEIKSSGISVNNPPASLPTATSDSISFINDEGVYIIKGKSLTGIASFYSRSLEGTETATGEIFRHANLTAASNNFKLNTWVRITNLNNGKSIIVRINDRMHPRMAAKGRVVDLTMTGAKKLDFVKSGLTKVKVEPIVKQ